MIDTACSGNSRHVCLDASLKPRLAALESAIGCLYCGVAEDVHTTQRLAPRIASLERAVVGQGGTSSASHGLLPRTAALEQELIVLAKELDVLERDVCSAPSARGPLGERLSALGQLLLGGGGLPAGSGLASYLAQLRRQAEEVLVRTAAIE
ncbi:unnamed protein product, partial [Polarella glacialis]